MTQTQLSTEMEVVRRIVSEGAHYGRSDCGVGQKALVEFVSANPNGPISVTSGRNAALGDSIASLLDAVGYHVTREYYINDAVNSPQMTNLGKSVFYRYRQLLGHTALDDDDVEQPDWLYHGEYVIDIAREVQLQYGNRFEDADPNDTQIVEKFRDIALKGMLARQKADLAVFEVVFDNWFSEESLHADGRVAAAIKDLTAGSSTYEKDGAIWLRSTVFGDTKDRVLVRSGDVPTYIAGDVAYHRDKYDRGFDLMIDVWGPEHAGYVARAKAAVAELGYDPDRLEIVIYQSVRLRKDGEYVKSSKRGGETLELKADVIDEIGKDAARFFYLMQPAKVELDIDLDIARERERGNPFYDIQNAWVLLTSTIDKSREIFPDVMNADLKLLDHECEIELARKLADYSEAVAVAARERAPEQIIEYIGALTSVFYAFYEPGEGKADLRIDCPKRDIMRARVLLSEATRIVIENALGLLGVSASEG